MKTNYPIHDSIYVQAREAKLAGWGGNERLANASLVDRFMALKGIPVQGKLLELGCGEGHHCRAFAQLGYEVSGIDISATAIEWAKEKATETGIPSTFLVADLTDVSQQLPERYNVVIDGNCLHCIIGDDRLVFLAKVYEALKANGVFFVSSLCCKEASNHIIEKDGYAYRHVAAAQSLIEELQQAGFIISATTRYQRDTHDHLTIDARKLG